MVSASEASTVTPIVPGSPAVVHKNSVRARQKVVEMLLQPFPLRDGQIAAACGVSRRLVCKVKAELKEKALDEVFMDGRVRSGRKMQFGEIYALVAALKEAYPSAGGHELWATLRGEYGYEDAELPSADSINTWLSRQKMTHRRVTGKTDYCEYLRPDAQVPLGEVGMDACWGMETKGGVPFGIVSVKDTFTGAVYSEPFLYDPRGDFTLANNPTNCAGVYMRFCQHIGIPQTLVMDNGMGQLPNESWLPEVCLHALAMGSVVEFELPNHPWKNGAVESWNNDIQRWWCDHKYEYNGVHEAFEAVRKRALHVCKFFPKSKNGSRPPADLISIRDWPTWGTDAGPVKLDRLHAVPSNASGTVRFQRKVRQGGLVIIADPDVFYVGEGLVGSNVRVTMVIEPGGGGPGEVETKVNNSIMKVATFNHRLERGLVEKREKFPLVYNVKQLMAVSETDCRAKFYSEEIQQAQEYRISKRKPKQEPRYRVGTPSQERAER